MINKMEYCGFVCVRLINYVNKLIGLNFKCCIVDGVGFVENF